MRQVSEYWQFRKWSFFIFTIGFGAACISGGWCLHIKYVSDPGVWAFAPIVIATILGLIKFWQVAYKERK